MGRNAVSGLAVGLAGPPLRLGPRLYPGSRCRVEVLRTAPRGEDRRQPLVLGFGLDCPQRRALRRGVMPQACDQPSGQRAGLERTAVGVAGRGPPGRPAPPPRRPGRPPRPPPPPPRPPPPRGQRQPRGVTPPRRAPPPPRPVHRRP